MQNEVALSYLSVRGLYFPAVAFVRINYFVEVEPFTVFSNKIVPTQVDRMRAELANLNHCAVSFLSHAAVNLC